MLAPEEEDAELLPVGVVEEPALLVAVSEPLLEPGRVEMIVTEPALFVEVTVMTEVVGCSDPETPDGSTPETDKEAD